MQRMLSRRITRCFAWRGKEAEEGGDGGGGGLRRREWARASLFNTSLWGLAMAVAFSFAFAFERENVCHCL